MTPGCSSASGRRRQQNFIAVSGTHKPQHPVAFRPPLPTALPDDLVDYPIRVTVACAILYAALAARVVASTRRRRCPQARVEQLGGAKPSRAGGATRQRWEQELLSSSPPPPGQCTCRSVK